MIRAPMKIDLNPKGKKLVFNDDGETIEKPVEISLDSTNGDKKSSKHKNKFKKNDMNSDDVESKWYQLYDEYNSNELLEMKDAEFNTFRDFCRNCFEEEIQRLAKSK
jgi:ribosomal protein S3AE